MTNETMNRITLLLPALILLGLNLALDAQEPSPEGNPSPAPASVPDPVRGELSQVAEAYVKAYNAKELDAILALYTPEAAMIDDIDGLTVYGAKEIRELFERSFSDHPDRQIALEVIDARQIAAHLVIEEGIAHFSSENPEDEGESVAYEAILLKSPEKGWLIAQSRELPLAPEEWDPLADLHPLLGEWVLQGEQLQMELYFDLSPTGSYLLGQAITTSPAEGTIETDIRIGYDAESQQILWWTFDELGGFAQGVWRATDEGWLVQTSGVTAEGERTSAVQKLRFEGDDIIAWDSTHRFLAGEAQPEVSLRLVRRPPQPQVGGDGTESSDPSGRPNEETTPQPAKP